MPQSMNLKKLTHAVKLIQDGNTPFLTMYFVLKNEENETVVRLVNIEKDIQNEFAEKFRKFLSEKLSVENLVSGKVSSADERKYDVLEFDIDLVQPLDELKKLLELPDADNYSYKKDNKLKLDGYIFIMGNEKIKVSFYKEHYPMDSITRDTFVIFGRADSKFVKVPEDEIFKLNNKIDFLQIGETLYVLNMQVMETNFKIHNVLKVKAEAVITEMNKNKILENQEFINEIISETPAFARKVLRVNKESPVMKLPFPDIKKFVDAHPHLKGKLKFNKNGTKFSLHTKKSATLFIKLMDDDFLRSDLTQRLYDSITKDRMDSEEPKDNSKDKKKKSKTIS